MLDSQDAIPPFPFKEKGPEGPLKFRRDRLFSVSVAVVGIRRESYQAAVYRKRLELDGKADAVFMRKGGADLGPLLTGFAVALVLFDGEDVQVRVGRCRRGLDG